MRTIEIPVDGFGGALTIAFNNVSLGNKVSVMVFTSVDAYRAKLAELKAMKHIEVLSEGSATVY
jgi:hypothetical protein